MRRAAVAGLLEPADLERPEQRALLELRQPALLAQLAPQGLDVGLARLLSAARRDPPHPVLVAVAEEQRATLVVDNEPAHADPHRQPRGAACQLLEGAQPRGPGHRRIRRRRRREHVELRGAECSLLHAKLRPLAEHSSVCLLADEGDPLRLELTRDRGQPLR